MSEKGRPLKYGEPVEKRHFNFPVSLSKRLNEAARNRGEDVTKVLHDALKRDLDDTQPKPSVSDEVRQAIREVLQEEKGMLGNLKLYRPVIAERDALIKVKRLRKVPCGPWAEAIEEANDIEISTETAAFIGYQDGDFLVPADGESMVEAGIPDGSLVLMRPLKGGAKPRKGEVALVQVETTEGEYFGTIKHWYSVRTMVDLRDGQGRPYLMPVNVKNVTPIAVMRGLIAKTPKG